MILVTGAGGMIARHASRAAGDPPFRAWLHHPEPDLAARFSSLEVVVVELSDPATRRRALHGVQGVVHLAEEGVDHDGIGIEEGHVRATQDLLQDAIESGVRRVVPISTTGVYGHGAHVLGDEDTPVAPDAPQARSRAGPERIVLRPHRETELQTTILRHRFV